MSLFPLHPTPGTPGEGKGGGSIANCDSQFVHSTQELIVGRQNLSVPQRPVKPGPLREDEISPSAAWLGRGERKRQTKEFGNQQSDRALK